jgi:hypothetical protein
VNIHRSCGKLRNSHNIFIEIYTKKIVKGDFAIFLLFVPNIPCIFIKDKCNINKDMKMDKLNRQSIERIKFNLEMYKLAMKALKIIGAELARLCGLGTFNLKCSFDDDSWMHNDESVKKITEIIRKHDNIIMISNEIISVNVLYLEVSGPRQTTCYYIADEEVKKKVVNLSLGYIFNHLPKDLFARISGCVVVGRKNVSSISDQTIRLYNGIILEWGTTIKRWDIRWGMENPEGALS